MLFTVPLQKRRLVSFYQLVRTRRLPWKYPFRNRRVRRLPPHQSVIYENSIIRQSVGGHDKYT